MKFHGLTEGEPTEALSRLSDYIMGVTYAGRTVEQIEKAFNEGERQYRVFPGCVKKIDTEKGTVDADVSREEPDRIGDAVMVDGWDTENFEKNRVVPWMHDYRLPPIGTGIDVVKAPPALVGTTLFWQGDGEWGDFAREIFAMYASEPPFMSAFSVGFIPKRWKVRRSEPDEEGDTHFEGFDILEQELLEWSTVPVPMHPGALAHRNLSKDARRLISSSMGIFEHADRYVRPDPAEHDRELAEITNGVYNLWTRSLAQRIRAMRVN